MKKDLITPEAIQEEELKKYKPIPWTYDSEVKNDNDSLKIAEKLYGRKLEIPEKPEPLKLANQVPYHFDPE